MTIDKREVITIPKWIILIVLPIVIGGIGGYATSRFNAGKMESQFNYTQKRVDIMEQTKVDRNEFNQIEKLLIRIDTKLDDHIKDSK